MKPFAGYNKADKVIWTLIIGVQAALIVFSAFYKFHGIAYYPDSGSYLESSNELMKGIPGFFRTPLYPLVWAALRYIFGAQTGGWILLVAQCALFTYSLKYFHRSLTQAKLRPIFVSIAFGIMGLYPAFIFWNIFAMAESFALTGCIFLLYLTYRLVLTKSSKYLACTSLTIFLLITLKPIFIALLPIYFAYFIYSSFRRRMFLAGVGAMLLISGSVYLYSGWMERSYGLRMVSYANIINEYYTLKEINAFHNDSVKEPELKKILERRCAEFPDGNYYGQIWSYEYIGHLKELKAELDEASRNHPHELRLLYVKRLGTFAESSFYSLGGGPVGSILRTYTPIRLGLLYLLLIAAPFALMRIRRSDTSLYTVGWYCWAFILALFLTCIFGAMNDWGRLMLPAYPAAIFLTTVIVSIFFRWKSYDSTVNGIKAF